MPPNLFVCSQWDERTSYELVKSGITIDLKERVMELREGALELQEENYELKTKLRNLESELSLEKEMVFEKTIYYRLKDGKKEGPFCPRCFDVDKKTVRLQLQSGGGNGQWPWFCYQCKQPYQ